MNIPLDISLDDLFEILQNSTDPWVSNLIHHFEQYVPYRFLSPWLKGSKNEVVQQSQYFKNDCLYSLNTIGNNCIEINPLWNEYLITNSKILLDFSYWNLLQYLQTRNPNVPNIGNKLIKPIVRKSLNRQRSFWNLVLDESDSLKCIYTGKILQRGKFDVEHFIPWSFVSHDQLWNLIPADSSVNCSKSNKLPPLERYFDSFVEMQYKAIKIILNKQSGIKMLEDYLIIGSCITDIVEKPYYEFKEKYYKVLSPLIQIASNSGFEYWNNNKDE
ncbi:MAG: HNH endonuclease domain-containing protein [Candidatus Saccharimonadaceae bacterium]